MKRIERLDANNFWPIIENREFLVPGGPLNFTEATGYHVYADLKLRLDLSAPENDQAAMRCLELLEDFTTISDRCANLAGLRVLEAQGERIHFLLPEPAMAPENLRRLLNFSAALTDMAYSELKPSAGDGWKAFSMAAAFGPAVFVPSSFAEGSLVSLGSAANRPAKRLGKGVPSGHLALAAEIADRTGFRNRKDGWAEIDVKREASGAESFF